MMNLKRIKTLEESLSNIGLTLDKKLLNMSDALDGIEELSKLLTKEGREDAYNRSVNYFRVKVLEVGTSLKNIYSNTINNPRFNIKIATTYLLVALFLLQASCATTEPNKPTIRPNCLKGKETFLNRVLTEEELKKLKGNFEQNPEQYSRELFDSSLARMHHISASVADEYAQNPELNYGITSPSEVKGTYYICSILDEAAKKSSGIPPDLFEDKTEYEEGIFKIILEWRGNKTEKENWSGWFPHSRILSVEPLGFEKGAPLLHPRRSGL